MLPKSCILGATIPFCELTRIQIFSGKVQKPFSWQEVNSFLLQQNVTPQWVYLPINHGENVNFDTKTITSPLHCKLLTGPPQYLRLLEISPRTYVKELKMPHSVTFLQLFTKLVLNLIICFHYFFSSFYTSEIISKYGYWQRCRP